MDILSTLNVLIILHPPPEVNDIASFNGETSLNKQGPGWGMGGAGRWLENLIISLIKVKILFTG